MNMYFFDKIYHLIVGSEEWCLLYGEITQMLKADSGLSSLH